MRRLVPLTLLVLLAISVTACAVAMPEPVGAKISPGTQIGDLVFVQGSTETISYVATMKCPVDQSASAQSVSAKSCVLRVGTKANIGKGFLDDDLLSGKTLDEKWSDRTLEMVVEGRAVDLQAFGYIDTSQAGIGTLRTPNIVVVANKPGKVTVRSTGVYDGDPFDDGVILAFTETGS